MKTKLKKALKVLVLLGCLRILEGCATSPLWYANHSQRQVVTVDGMKISVIPRGPDRYDAVYFGAMVVGDTLMLREKQIKAVETISGCVVIASEYMPNSIVLNTKVGPKQ